MVTYQYVLDLAKIVVIFIVVFTGTYGIAVTIGNYFKVRKEKKIEKQRYTEEVHKDYDKQLTETFKGKEVQNGREETINTGTVEGDNRTSEVEQGDPNRTGIPAEQRSIPKDKISFVTRLKSVFKRNFKRHK